MFDTLDEVVKYYKDDPIVHRMIWEQFLANVEADYELNNHRTWIEQRQRGYGERQFHWVWKLLVDAMPASFTFCEIGVYKGQTLSLVGLLAQMTKKQAKIIGVTPLNSTGDKYATHEDAPYEALIGDAFKSFNLPQPLLVDDASNYLDIPNGLIPLDWKGLEEVSDAVAARLSMYDDRYTELFACGHNRIFQRIKEPHLWA